MKILIAIHGSEPPGWAQELVRVLPLLSSREVRALVVIDVPTPPLTSPGPWARRRYRSALAAWRNQEEAKAKRSLEALTELLPSPFAVVAVRSFGGDPGKVVVEHAGTWGADLIVIAPDAPGLLHALLLGTTHQRVVQHAPCAVLVLTSRETTASRRIVRRPRLAWTAPKTARSAAAG